jgi:photosystem II stability/assembly factor-like uncharacterized protein
MIYRRLFVCVLILSYVVFNGSCSKDPPPDPPPAVDTLGTGWQKLTIPGVTGLADVFFVNAQVGFVCGNEYIGKSTDGGLTWSKASFPSGIGSFMNLFFINGNSGWAVSQTGVLVRTTDGGNTWNKVANSPQAVDVQFLNERLGYLASTNGLFKSIDSGNTWTKTPASLSAGGLYFSDSLTGWVTYSGQAKKTINGGTDFTNLQNVAMGGYIIQFMDPLHGWIAGGNGVQRTVDGGNSWTNIPTTYPLNGDIHFFDSNKGYVIDQGHIYKTSDGGATLTRLVKLAQGSLIECHFTDEQHGWAVSSSDGILLRYVQ